MVATPTVQAAATGPSPDPFAYRPDIDGLRALAVIAVILFHSELSLFGRDLLPGGFLGVDVFFVISGYLITALVTRRIQDGTFSLLGFFDRRARRILPALFALLIVTGLTALIFPSITDMRALGREMLAALAFGANILFAFEDSYFAAEAQLRPLLHTWSLGVEEQFYLLWPFALLLLVKVRRPLILVAIVMLLCFAASHVYAVSRPNLAFNLLPFRMWELMAGAALALGLAARMPAFGVKAVRAVGWALILIPMILWSPGWPHPSWPALMPVIGTVLLIRVGSGLSSAPFVVLGRISYSLYLWHFMALAFARGALGRDLGLSLTLLVIGWAVLLSVISFRLIEQPFRDRTRMGGARAYGLLGLGAVLIVMMASVLIGRPQLRSLPVDLQALLSQSERTVLRQDGAICRSRSPDEACRYGGGSERPIYLVGDSHAEMLAPALARYAEGRDRPLVLLLEGGCPVLFDRAYRPDYPAQRQGNCPRQSTDMRAFLQDAPPGTIIYFTYLSAYLGYPGQAALSTDSDPAGRAADYPVQAAIATFTDLSRRGHDIILIDPAPVLPETPKEALDQAFRPEDRPTVREIANALPQVTAETYESQLERVGPVFSRIERDAGASRVELGRLLCLEAACAVMDADGLLYSDTNHVSPHGAERVVAEIIDVMEER